MVAAHAPIMVFLTIMPARRGAFGNDFAPTMIDAPNMAFPRMDDVSVWLRRSDGRPNSSTNDVDRPPRQGRIRRMPHRFASLRR